MNASPSGPGGSRPAIGGAMALGALIVCATVLAYLPALRGGFIWDDDTFLTQNKLIKASDGVCRFWFTRDAPDYWPVTSTTLWLEWRLWGMNAMGYHATNIALHAVEALLVWRILHRLRVPGSYLAGFIFAVHPVNVESVAWITQRKNLMAMLFFLAAILLFLRTGTADGPRAGDPSPGRRADRALWYGLSLLAFALGMLSKGSVAMLPVVLLGLVAWRRRPTLGELAAVLPFFAVSAVLAIVDIRFQEHAGSAEVIRNAGVFERLSGAGAVVWFYLYKILLPVNLAFIYPQWRIEAADVRWWIAPLAAIGVSALLWCGRGGWARPLLFAWGYFCVMLVPVMGLTDVYFMRYSLVADHYSHLAMIGVVAASAAGWALWRDRSHSGPRRGVPVVVAASALGILACLTWRQCAIYRDEQTLYEATILKNPGCWLAHNNLGFVWSKEPGRLDDAVAQFEEALRLKPDYAEAHNNLGLAWFGMPGRLNDAVAQFEEAVRLKPSSAEAHNNLGLAWAQMPGRLNDAVAQYEEALRLAPGFAGAHDNLGLALSKMPGRLGDSVAQFEEALRLQPDSADARTDLGSALSDSPGRLADAIAQFEEALRLRPDSAEAHYDLGNALSKTTGRLGDAIAQYREAVRLQPDFAQGWHNLGVGLYMMGNLPAAADAFERAVRLQPDSAEAHYDLGLALSGMAGRLDDAVAQYDEALRLSPRFSEARNARDAALRQAGGH